MVASPGVNQPCDRMWPLAGVLLSSQETVSLGGQRWIQALGDTWLSRRRSRMPGPEYVALSRWCEEKQKPSPIQFFQLTLFKPLLGALYQMRRFIERTIPAFPCHAGKEKKICQSANDYLLSAALGRGRNRKEEPDAVPALWRPIVWRPEPQTGRIWTSTALGRGQSVPSWAAWAAKCCWNKKMSDGNWRQQPRKRWWSPNSTGCAGGWEPH